MPTLLEHYSRTRQRSSRQRAAQDGRSQSSTTRQRDANRNASLDGLRCVAVAGVLAFHFRVPGAEAGFLGVDLFFVLSGFLITSILLTEVERGKVRLAHFWTRRIRRLAPALLLALGAMIVWGALEASMTSRDDLRADITATLAYVANWHFISTSSYFHASGDPSPLQHMWSLAVEEQFYVVWPVALFLVALLVPTPRTRLAVVAAVAVCGVFVSAWRLESLWAGAGTSDRAFMGTDSRIFGPLVGALLAVVLMHAPRLGSGRRMHIALLVGGSATLAWAMLEMGSPHGPSDWYPRGGALLFAFGSAAVIWGLSTRASRASAVLAFAPVAYLGRISYGIYIWHWPLVLWAQQDGWMNLSDVPTAPRIFALTATTVALAALSYHAIEKPIRYGFIGRHLNGRSIAVALPAVLGALIVLNTAVVVPRAGAELTSPTRSSGDRPRLTKTVILVGDSVPQALGDEFAQAARRRGYVVIRATAGGCPATAASKAYSSGARFENNTCPEVAREQDAKIKAYRPALVIWWSRYEIAPRLASNGKLLPLGSKAYWRAQRASFTKRALALTRRGARLVTVQIEPPGRALAVRNPSEEAFLVGQTLLRRSDIVKAWNAFLARHKGPKVFSISIDRRVCRDAKSPCDDRLPNGVTARPDGVHYSETAGRRLASQILQAAWRIAGLMPEPRR